MHKMFKNIINSIDNNKSSNDDLLQYVHNKNAIIDWRDAIRAIRVNDIWIMPFFQFFNYDSMDTVYEQNLLLETYFLMNKKKLVTFPTVLGTVEKYGKSGKILDQETNYFPKNKYYEKELFLPYFSIEPCKKLLKTRMNLTNTSMYKTNAENYIDESLYYKEDGLRFFFYPYKIEYSDEFLNLLNFYDWSTNIRDNRLL